jgi:iron transport multicopper oxidase
MGSNLGTRQRTSAFFFKHFLFTALFAGTLGKHLFYDFRVGYICGSPDGVTVCHILGVNGKFPGPRIEANLGDTLHVTVHNQIQDREGPQKTSIHWYGIFQRGSQHEDGADMVTGCPIPFNQSYTYKFKLRQTGTFW